MIFVYKVSNSKGPKKYRAGNLQFDAQEPHCVEEYVFILMHRDVITSSQICRNHSLM